MQTSNTKIQSSAMTQIEIEELLKEFDTLPSIQPNSSRLSN
jgi:hypothetical protein